MQIIRLFGRPATPTATKKAPTTGAVLIVAVVLAATACSTTAPGSDALATTAPTSSSSTSSSATTAPTSSTTITEPTTTSPTYTEEEAAVIEVHTRFLTEVLAIDERVEDPNSRIPLAEELATGAQLQRFKDNIALRQADGVTRSGSGMTPNIITVEVDDTNASVLDCVMDTSSIFNADGELLSGPDDFHYKLRSLLVKIDDHWLIEDTHVGNLERCDPLAP